MQVKSVCIKKKLVFTSIVPSIDEVSIRGRNMSQRALTQGYKGLITTLTLLQTSLMWPLQPQHSHTLWMDDMLKPRVSVEKIDHSCMRQCPCKSKDMCQLIPAITEAEVKMRRRFMEICKAYLQDRKTYQSYPVKVQLNKIFTENDIY